MSSIERNRDVYESHWRARFRRKWNYSSQTKVRRFARLMGRMGWLERRGMRVFDCGFGLGLMLFCFDRSAFLAGVELSESAVEAARVEAGRKGYRGVDFRVLEVGGGYPVEWKGSFDVVVCSHVLEHLEEPGVALRRLIELVREGGIAVLAVPINEKPGEDLNHFSHFTAGTFVELVKGSGLEVIQMEECDRLWDVIAPLGYRLQRRRTVILRLASLAVNACTGILPWWALRGVDDLLGWMGFRNRQVFVVGRMGGTS